MSIDKFQRPSQKEIKKALKFAKSATEKGMLDDFWRTIGANAASVLSRAGLSSPAEILRKISDSEQKF